MLTTQLIFYTADNHDFQMLLKTNSNSFHNQSSVSVIKHHHDKGVFKEKKKNLHPNCLDPINTKISYALYFWVLKNIILDI